MDKSAVKEIVDREIKGMMNMLGVVRSWRINVLYESPSNQEWMASCERLLSYQRATIRIDPARHDTEAEVIDSLRHELIHVLLAPLDAYRDIVTASIEADSSMDCAESRAWELAIETTVLSIERMFDWAAKEKPVEVTAEPKKAKRKR